MIELKRTLTLPYTCAQIYALVADIEKYPKFLPFCQTVKVLWHRGNQLEATVVVGYKGLQHDFTTQNTNVANRKITMELSKGPLKSLKGAWVFAESEHGCDISFQLNAEFKSNLLDMLLKPKTSDFTDKFIDAFVERARALYG